MPVPVAADGAVLQHFPPVGLDFCMIVGILSNLSKAPTVSLELVEPTGARRAVRDWMCSLFIAIAHESVGKL